MAAVEAERRSEGTFDASKVGAWKDSFRKSL